MFTYFCKLWNGRPAADAAMQSERNFHRVDAALERARWHARLPGAEYRSHYILDEQSAIIVMNAKRFQAWLIRCAVKEGAA